MITCNLIVTIVAVAALTLGSLQHLKKTRVFHQGLLNELKAEIALHRCGQRLADARNIEEAKKYFLRLYPERGVEIHAAAGEILEDTAINTQTECSDARLPGIVARPYRQTNSSLPRSWANWHYRLERRSFASPRKV